jgi:hypothetical protein
VTVQPAPVQSVQPLEVRGLDPAAVTATPLPATGQAGPVGSATVGDGTTTARPVEPNPIKRHFQDVGALATNPEQRAQIGATAMYVLSKDPDAGLQGSVAPQSIADVITLATTTPKQIIGPQLPKPRDTFTAAADTVCKGDRTCTDNAKKVGDLIRKNPSSKNQAATYSLFAGWLTAGTLTAAGLNALANPAVTGSKTYSTSGLLLGNLVGNGLTSVNGNLQLGSGAALPMALAGQGSRAATLAGMRANTAQTSLLILAVGTGPEEPITLAAVAVFAAGAALYIGIWAATHHDDLPQIELPAPAASQSAAPGGAPDPNDPNDPRNKNKQSVQANVDTPLYRGGSKMTARPGVDVKPDKTGMIPAGRGISLNSNAADKFIVQYGGPHQVDLGALPDGLQVVRTSGTHYELAPTRSMTVTDYQNLLDKVKINPLK